MQYVSKLKELILCPIGVEGYLTNEIIQFLAWFVLLIGLGYAWASLGCPPPRPPHVTEIFFFRIFFFFEIATKRGRYSCAFCLFRGLCLGKGDIDAPKVPTKKSGLRKKGG